MYYAAINYKADQSSMGFSNTWNVHAFDSKRERDNFVSEKSVMNKSAKAIARKDISTYIEKTQNPGTGKREFELIDGSGDGEYGDGRIYL